MNIAIGIIVGVIWFLMTAYILFEEDDE